jgi:hypothetical protein
MFILRHYTTEYDKKEEGEPIRWDECYSTYPIKKSSQSFPEQNENARQDGHVSFFSSLAETPPLPAIPDESG